MRVAIARSRRVAGGLIALLSVLEASPALAEAPPAPPAPPASAAAQPMEVARARYRQGVEAYKAGHYRESIDYFLEADRASPSAALSFNIAVAYEKIDDVAAALRWYRDYLRRAPDAKDRANVDGIVQTLEGRLAAKGVQQITVMSEPAGATLTVDDKPVGVTPWTMELPPGAHQIELRRDGYEIVRQSIDVAKDHAADVQVTLTATAAAPASPATTPAAPPIAVAPTTSNVEDHGSGRALTTWGVVGLAAGGAALGGALTFEIMRRSAETAAKGERTQVGYADEVDTMQSRQTVARVLLGTGLALAATGGILLFLGQKESSGKEASLGVGCSFEGCLSTVRGRF